MATELNLHLQRCDERRECRKHDRVQQTLFGLEEVQGDVLHVSVEAWVQRGVRPRSGVVTCPTCCAHVHIVEHYQVHRLASS